MRRTLALSSLALASGQGQTVPLFNAAQPGQTMPAVGLGTGGCEFLARARARPPRARPPRCRARTQ